MTRIVLGFIDALTKYMKYVNIELQRHRRQYTEFGGYPFRKSLCRGIRSPITPKLKLNNVFVIIMEKLPINSLRVRDLHIKFQST